MGTATILNGLLGGEYLINLGWDVPMPNRDNYDQLLLKTVEYLTERGVLSMDMMLRSSHIKMKDGSTQNLPNPDFDQAFANSANSGTRQNDRS